MAQVTQRSGTPRLDADVTHATRTSPPSGGHPRPVTNFTLQHDIANLESQIASLQRGERTLQSESNQQGGTLSTLGSDLGSTSQQGTQPSSGGLLSSGMSRWLLIGGVLVIGYFGYRYLQQRKGSQGRGST